MGPLLRSSQGKNQGTKDIPAAVCFAVVVTTGAKASSRYPFPPPFSAKQRLTSHHPLGPWDFLSRPFVCGLYPFLGHKLESKYKKEKAKYISVEIPKETDVIAEQKWFQ